MPRRTGDERPSRTFKESPEFRAARAELGAAVRSRRLARALTLEAAAERMQLDLKHLQKVEAGQGNVTLVTLVRIAVGLDVPLRDLFAGAVGEPVQEPVERVRAYGTRPAPIATAADRDRPPRRARKKPR